MTRFTGVCCSMNSLTSTPHAPNPDRRHGSSRALSRYHAMSGVARSGMRISLRPAHRRKPTARTAVGWNHAPSDHARHDPVARAP